MEYKCNKCGDEFVLEIQDKWSAWCFHCGKGLLQLIKTDEDSQTKAKE